MTFHACPTLIKRRATPERRDIHLPKQATRIDVSMIHETGQLSIAQDELDDFSHAGIFPGRQYLWLSRSGISVGQCLVDCQFQIPLGV